MIDVYQAATQMTDESGQTFPFTIDTLLDRRARRRGLLRRVHREHAHRLNVDARPDPTRSSPSALARGVPVITARQMLDWLDGRNASTFGAVTRTGATTDLHHRAGHGATGLYACCRSGDRRPAVEPDPRRVAGDLHHADDQGRAVRDVPGNGRRLRRVVYRAAQTTITAAPAATTNSTSASFTFTANPATGATFQCSLDGAAYATCTSPRSLTGLAAGTHTFQVRAVSANGTDPTPASHTWLITTTPPDTTLTSTPAASTTSTSAEFTFTANPAAGATFQCSLDGAAYATCTSPRSLTGLAIGNHTFNVRG